jgi:hypothetical protein
MTENLQEKQACIPLPVNASFLNRSCKLPYGLASEHILNAMTDFIDFLQFINTQLFSRELPRLESFLMPANFSSIVGEYMNTSIPKRCKTLVKNRYHNGHPDLLPNNVFPDNSAQHASEGIEVKGSRHLSGWQGHNPESIWLLVFCFDSNTSNDFKAGLPPKAFRFLSVYAAKLDKNDWTFSGRSRTSRRTITASVNQKGAEKMKSNWIYQVPEAG